MNRKKIWLYYHLIVKRDIYVKFFTKRFKYFGKGSIIFKPLTTDRKSKTSVSIGDNTIIGKYARINTYGNPPPNITIGKFCNIGQRFSLLAGGNITIEDRVLIASDVIITSENHSIDPESSVYYADQPLECKDVLIKEGCWIGEKVCVLAGVTIGKKSIVGAGAVVTHDIPDYCIAVGNPAHIIKKYNFANHKWEKYF